MPACSEWAIEQLSCPFFVDLTARWGNGSVFEGTYVANKRNGQGKLSMPDKSVFTGEKRWCEEAFHVHAFFEEL